MSLPACGSAPNFNIRGLYGILGPDHLIRMKSSSIKNTLERTALVSKLYIKVEDISGTYNLKMVALAGVMRSGPSSKRTLKFPIDKRFLGNSSHSR